MIFEELNNKLNEREEELKAQLTTSRNIEEKNKIRGALCEIVILRKTIEHYKDIQKRRSDLVEP